MKSKYKYTVKGEGGVLVLQTNDLTKARTALQQPRSQLKRTLTFSRPACAEFHEGHKIGDIVQEQKIASKSGTGFYYHSIKILANSCLEYYTWAPDIYSNRYTEEGVV